MPAGLRRTIPLDVIGPDNRTRVTDTAAWPYAPVGRIVSKFGSKTMIGTGTIIASRHVLTAGHVLFDPKLGGWADSVTFQAAKNEALEPFGSIPVKRLVSVKGWVEKQNPDFDFAVAVLDEPTGIIAGYHAFEAFTDLKLSKLPVRVTGYPGDKGGKQMWTHADRLKSAAAEKVYYDIDTMPGQSGAAVYYEDEGLIVAIHATGAGSGNGAVRITSAKKQYLLDVIRTEQ